MGRFVVSIYLSKLEHKYAAKPRKGASLKDLQFIKADIPFRAEFSYDLPAPQFRKKFAMKPFKKAVVYVAGLGIGNFWLNGRKFSDLFISAVSDYRKTVWYHRYDVTEFLREGENVLAIWCGNGFYNENFDSAWESKFSL